MLEQHTQRVATIALNLLIELQLTFMLIKKKKKSAAAGRERTQVASDI